MEETGTQETPETPETPETAGLQQERGIKPSFKIISQAQSAIKHLARQLGNPWCNS